MSSLMRIACSVDLRKKIVRAYDPGLGSQHKIAELFGVSRSFVEKLLDARGQNSPQSRVHVGDGERENRR